MLYRLTLALALFWLKAPIDLQLQETCEFLSQEVLATHTATDAALIFNLSIAAPEYIRYRELSNLMEVQALRLMYAELGSAHVDFSVGYFQMKPSFIEGLEAAIGNEATLQKKYKELTDFSTSDASAIRSERINRILDIQYDIRYLQAFADLMRLRHPDMLQGACDQEALHFMATAYNLGLDSSLQDIRQYQSQKNFPYGSQYEGEQFAFGDLSIKIYSQLNNLLCISNH